MKEHSHNNRILNGITYLGDIAICFLLYAYYLVEEGYWGSYARTSLLIVGLIYAFFVMKRGVILYKRDTHDFQIPLLVLKNVLSFGIVGFLLISITDAVLLSVRHCLFFLLWLFVLSSVYRLIIRYIVKWWRKNDKHIRHAVIVGGTTSNYILYHELVGVEYLGYKVEGYFNDEPNSLFEQANCTYLGKPEAIIGYLKEHKNIHELYCCMEICGEQLAKQIVHYCVNNLVRFYNVPDVRRYLKRRMFFQVLGDVPYFSFYKEPLSSPSNRAIKRTFDICFSLAVLCTIFPIVFIVVFIITKLTMPGPIFFRQKRTGINDQTFYCLKFRSMKVNAEADTLQATENDPRKTKWGDFMRRTNIDELPQFINVLLGEMSVVGPRPHMLKHTEEYSQLIDQYMSRHFIKPGITGWSQVTGFRGETKELWQMEGRVKGDLWYMDHWSFGLDLYIIYKTVVNALSGDKEAY